MYYIKPMSEVYANEISQWIYPDEYSIYSFQNDDGTLGELMNGEYFVCINSQKALVGYFCFGKSAQIPTVENGVYNSTVLDIGLGLKPEFCGQGLGSAFLKFGIQYAKEHFATTNIQLTVACFNKRAICLYQNLGFIQLREVTHSKSLNKFYVMIYSE